MEIVSRQSSKIVDGLIRCGRYSFGPNRLHYCGPDSNQELKEMIERDGDGFGLSILLKQFKTLFPYLKHIAESNKIKDPFDARVVEAYWLGNSLLEREEKRSLYGFLAESLKIKDKMSGKEWSWLEEKISQGAVPHHSFHVLNVWDQKGHADKLADLERMGECIISCGKVIEVRGPEIEVSTEPLVWDGGKLALGAPIAKKIYRKLEAEYDIEQIKPGQLVSIHWSQPCEVISRSQAASLRKYTMQNIAFANFNL